MKTCGYKFLWMMLLVLMVSLLPCLQSRAGSITDAQWKELTSDRAFDYKDQKEMQKSPRQAPKENAVAKVWAMIVGFFSSPVGKAIIWIAFFLLLGYTIFKAFFSEYTQLFGRHKKIHAVPDKNIQIQPRDLLNTDWESYLKHALANNDTRLAIRYSYMQLLQLLQQAQYIQYRADKTNNDYYYELGSDDLKQTFRRLTRQYEFAWYGNYPVQQQAFNTYMDTFNAFKNRISRT